ncbi:MAG TPA: hypothetical protein VFI91_05000 [Longimicrobiaceae bacterium]|nr:hypothetical protein [Longimicrobiaceae bacterium]
MSLKILTPLFVIGFLLPAAADAQEVSEPKIANGDAAPVVIPSHLLLRLDSLQPRISWEERVLQGAITGAVTGLVLSGVRPDCAAVGSAAGTSFTGAVMGGLRGLFADDPPPKTTTEHRNGDPRILPFPFEDETCDGNGQRLSHQ